MVKTKQNTRHIGNQGEEHVAQKLIADGFKILARNYAKRYGEIDIIAQKGEIIACVEVKLRHKMFFDATEIITRSKQKKIIAVAKEFLSAHTNGDVVCRFDVALIEKETNSLCYIPNAFCQEE